MGARALALAAWTLAAGVAQAQVCNDRIAFATPNGRFAVSGTGIATDLRTGLTWQRCPVGFTFDDNGTPLLEQDDRCTPGATTTFTWQQALQDAEALNLAGGYNGLTDWRLPNIKELASIVETRCAAPSINLAVFPGTPSVAVFWSASHQVGPPTFVSVQCIDFGTGQDRNVGKASLAHVRLVR
jgi:hypothetical protein